MNKRKLQRFWKLYPWVKRPFKGNVAYELQIFNIVLMWRFDGTWHNEFYTITKGLTIGPLHIWIDRSWL